MRLLALLVITLLALPLAACSGPQPAASTAPPASGAAPWTTHETGSGSHAVTVR